MRGRDMPTYSESHSHDSPAGDVIANVAVPGRAFLPPGQLPVQLEQPEVTCLVSYDFPENIVDPRRGIKVITGDCTVFNVRFRGQGSLDLSEMASARLLFDQSLLAISEALLWTKAHDASKRMLTFARQIGVVDVKAFFAYSEDRDLVVGWANPVFAFTRDVSAYMAGLFPQMIMSNGPAAHPLPPLVKQVMGILDLVNLGFHTEAFVNLFSLVDDLVQEVVKAGLVKKDMDNAQQKELLRAIKEERLKIYLCNLSKLCGWSDLKEANEELYRQVVKVNGVRNRVMHGGLRLPPSDAIESVRVLLSLIGWLRLNPFGYPIPQVPLLVVAEPTLKVLPVKSGASEESGDSKGLS